MMRIEEYDARHRDESREAADRCGRRDLLTSLTEPDAHYVGRHEADVEVAT